jgi:hypothetical protein
MSLYERYVIFTYAADILITCFKTKDQRQSTLDCRYLTLLQVVWQVMRCNGTRWPGCGNGDAVTLIGPLGGFWSELCRKRVTG